MKRFYVFSYLHIVERKARWKWHQIQSGENVRSYSRGSISTSIRIDVVSEVKEIPPTVIRFARVSAGSRDEALRLGERLFRADTGRMLIEEMEIWRGYYSIGPSSYIEPSHEIKAIEPNMIDELKKAGYNGEATNADGEGGGQEAGSEVPAGDAPAARSEAGPDEGEAVVGPAAAGALGPPGEDGKDRGEASSSLAAV